MKTPNYIEPVTVAGLVKSQRDMFNGRYKHPTQALEVKENENPALTAIRGLATLIITTMLEDQ
jgi:hypothetical protein